MRTALTALKQQLFPERKFRAPRVWSNTILRRLAPLFSGSVVNVSGWKDSDKEGGHYKDYFTNASSYAITNYPSKRGGEEGTGWISLDLEKDAPAELRSQYDVVFNHTTLEHVFEVNKAFESLCTLSRDIVLIVVPFLQEMHIYEDGYKDYWRFTPYAVRNLFEQNGFTLLYIDVNDRPKESVYVVAVGSKQPANWQGKLPAPERDAFRRAGSQAISAHGPLYSVGKRIVDSFRFIFRGTVEVAAYKDGEKE